MLRVNRYTFKTRSSKRKYSATIINQVAWGPFIDCTYKVNAMLQSFLRPIKRDWVSFISFAIYSSAKKSIIKLD